jgi:hypothetical protein
MCSSHPIQVLESTRIEHLTSSPTREPYRQSTEPEFSMSVLDLRAAL